VLIVILMILLSGICGFVFRTDEVHLNQIDPGIRDRIKTFLLAE